MDRYLLPSHLITSQAHWDAMADALGDADTLELYGPRPELANTADYVRPLYNDRAPRRAVWVAAGLGLVMAASVLWGATHERERAVIEPCALVLTREHGPVCR
jgi:hypothetical protein